MLSSRNFTYKRLLNVLKCGDNNSNTFVGVFVVVVFVVVVFVVVVFVIVVFVVDPYQIVVIRPLP